MKKFLLLILILASGFWYLGREYPQVSSVFDFSAPKLSLSIEQAEQGRQVVFSAEESFSGLSELTLRSLQAGQEKVKKQIEITDAKKVSGTLALQELTKETKDGELELELAARDKSFWANTSKTTTKLVVDSRPPQLEVLSLQHVVAVGGSEFVILRAHDPELSQVRVEVGDIHFPAFSLALADEAFTNEKDLYGVFFALPLRYDAKQEKVRAVAQDAFGNTRKVDLFFRVKPYAVQQKTPMLSTSFLIQKIPDLLREASQDMEKNWPEGDDVEAANTEQRITMFRTVNEEYRAFLAEKLSQLLLGKIRKRVFDKDFLKPMASATSSAFGEFRNYSYEGKSAGSSMHHGVDLASVQHDKVIASHSGTVLYTGPLGIYGEAVVLDHGLGLTSLYGHLSSISTQEGDTVQKGDVIGRSGVTGLAGGDHLHFEYRLNNIPVTPYEWWDPKWIEDHFFGKLRLLKATHIASDHSADPE